MTSKKALAKKYGRWADLDLNQFEFHDAFVKVVNGIHVFGGEREMMVSHGNS